MPTDRPRPSQHPCLGCGTALPDAFLDLGSMPIANAFLPPERIDGPEPTYPLAVTHCPECQLVQLTDLLAPEELFADYPYFSSYSDTFLEHARGMARDLLTTFDLTEDSFVVEVGSNDGYLLQYFAEDDIPILGIEPAENVAAVARSKDLPTLVDFFGRRVADTIVQDHGEADLLIGNNVLAHMPRIDDTLRAVSQCLKPRGRAVFEFPWLLELIERNEFDTIYHEHVFYLSLSAISSLAPRFGLAVVDVMPQSIHGGSLRVFLSKSEQPPGPRVQEIMSREEKAGLCRPDRYRAFADTVEQARDELLQLLRQLCSSDKTVVGYGAPAKGNTLLNYCGIGRELIPFTVDRNPNKQGRYLPGTHIPIHDPEVIRGERPDYVLVLPWNLKEEILTQLSYIREWGGQFIVPIPRPQVFA